MTIKVRHALTNACDVLADVSAVQRCDLVHFDPLCCCGGNDCVCACVCVVCVCVNTFRSRTTIRSAEEWSSTRLNLNLAPA
jgi:hypothetical protein